MENKEPNEKVIIKYSSYTPAQKRATQKYRQNNKEKVNEQRKKYYQSRKEKDPEFLEYKRTKAKEYYQRKKAQKETEQIIEKVEEHIPEPEPIIEPVIEPVKVKRTRKPKVPKEEEIKSDSVFDKTELGQLITQAIEEIKETKKTKRAKKSKEV
jgi:hypothetical protein